MVYVQLVYMTYIHTYVVQRGPVPCFSSYVYTMATVPVSNLWRILIIE